MAWAITILSITALLVVNWSSAVEFEKCVQMFLNDTSDLDHNRFQGYWYVKYTYLPYRPGYPEMDVQSIYAYEPGVNVGVWFIATGMSITDGLCFRRLIRVNEATPGARLFKEFTYFHHIIDTDYDNYAVILFCLGISPSGRCEYPDLKTVILSRTPGDLQKTNVWSKVKAAINDCADPSRLTETDQENICACRDANDFTLGLGKECPERNQKLQ